MVSLLKEFFAHRSLIIVLQPGTSDVPYMGFAHKKKELFRGKKATTIS